MHANLDNPVTHQVKQVKVGFSWTTFFFGFFPALFRGDFKWFGIILLLDILAGIPTNGIGATVVTLVFSFIYNKLYINDLIRNGFKPSDESSSKVLLAKGFSIPVDSTK